MAAIREDSTYISVSAIKRLIEELEEASGFEVIRVRNDEVLFSTDSETSAVNFIDTNDYDKTRVVVRSRDNGNTELRDLRDLRDAIIAMDRRFWDKDKSLYRLVPGTSTVTYNGQNFVFLQTFVD